MDEDSLPRKGVRKVDFEYNGEDRTMGSRVYISASDKELTAFSSVCTHLGCFINWDHNKKEFICPCHGGRYGIDGNVTAGPPPAPLARLPLEIKDGKVYIGMKI
ncbi:MAG: Rieske 2Fe-2S domain-containing protein [Nitrospirae bacterium]|nr:Rieske 2Fe-2S domain-containing protein [Nitrospirota bacterium]